MRITEFNTVVDDNGKKYLIDEWLDTIEKGDYNKKWIEYNEEEKKYTVHEIVSTLQQMKMLELKGKGYIPEYERTDLTDDLHNFLGINTDNEIINYKKIKKILDSQEK